MDETKEQRNLIDFKSTLKIALTSLKVNNMRSMLTSLGIIIGVSAVIIMLAIGTGAQEKVQANMESMGTNLLTLRGASATSGGVRMGMGSTPTLTTKDAHAIRQHARGIDALSPCSSQSKQVTYGNQNWATSIYGIMPDYMYVKNFEIDQGRKFTMDDIRNAANIAIIGKTIETELFGDVDSLGKTIRIGGVPFKVIGTLTAKGQTGPFDQDDLIFIPLTTGQRKIFGTEFPNTVDQIVVKCYDDESIETAIEDINEILMKRHNISANQTKDFEIRNSAEFQEKMKSTVTTFAILLASIASVSLLVGGIGIMNIMLVSVTERTKEIGIRMAIGARAWDIRWQFLIESFLLSIIGGLIGVFVGVVGSLLVGFFASEMSVKISLFSIFLSLGFSGLVGIGFGYYPAYKASLLKPIDALRYE